MIPIEIEKKLPELANIERVIDSLGDQAHVEILETIRYKDLEFPIHAIVLGTQDPEAPSVGYYGGVHGLERIGSKVVIAYLETISQLLTWDDTLHDRLKETRMVFVPLLNPVGTFLKRRANGNGVDLMRNAPVLAKGVPLFPMGGHRLSPKLPWFRGFLKNEIELESKALLNAFQKFHAQSQQSITIDVHSGFGAIDRLWFPYAKTVEPFPEYPEMYSLKTLFDRSYANHFYRIEPQARQYTTHGDLWDYIYDSYFEKKNEVGNYFLPLTLEMGSWMWIKKNPRQIFNVLGPFNPILPHRRQRILRRHITLFDFVHRAVHSPESWLKMSFEHKKALEQEALEYWYGR